MDKKEIIRQIDRYITGELDQNETDLLWIEFLKNPNYYDWFETELHLRHLIKKGSIQGDKPAEKPENFGTGNAKFWILAIAAIILLSFGIQYFSVTDGDVMTQIALDNIDHTELLGSDILRSDQQEVRPVDISINEALAEALEGNTKASIGRFREILSEFPVAEQKNRIEMNLAILLYNTSDFTGAKELFLNIIAAETVTSYSREKALWFLGNTYLNLEDPENAKDVLFEVYSLDGRFKNSASQHLLQLHSDLGMILPDDFDPSTVE